MRYRRQATALHAARAMSAGGYCLALVSAAVILDNPFVLGALLLAVVIAGLGAHSGAALMRALRLALPLVVIAAILNPLFTHRGLTVVARLGHLPPFGQVDITLEAMVFGAVFALKLTVVVLAFALSVAAVDPDEVLRGSRRLSFRSALSASLATRMWPVLHSDARRLTEAQRCRADAPGSASRAARWSRRVRIVQTVLTGSLDRALDLAATLEVRGYALARPAARPRRSWSRHDLAFAATAAALVGAAILARALGAGGFRAFPTVRASLGPAELVLGGALIALAAVPFADRRGVGR